jgi:hypothetical protein
VKTGKAKTYIEASALKNVGVEELFSDVAESAYEY